MADEKRPSDSVIPRDLESLRALCAHYIAGFDSAQTTHPTNQAAVSRPPIGRQGAADFASPQFYEGRILEIRNADKREVGTDDFDYLARIVGAFRRRIKEMGAMNYQPDPSAKIRELYIVMAQLCDHHRAHGGELPDFDKRLVDPTLA